MEVKKYKYLREPVLKYSKIVVEANSTADAYVNLFVVPNGKILITKTISVFCIQVIDTPDTEGIFSIQRKYEWVSERFNFYVVVNGVIQRTGDKYNILSGKFENFELRLCDRFFQPFISFEAVFQENDKIDIVMKNLLETGINFKYEFFIRLEGNLYLKSYLE
ncbi:MAG: hypothetical protein QXO40_00285 [Candidatus Aenigmatarchaeota archaeon]